mmetsp:Transcript_37787/g.76871  ORF Transcript_37787/g.76871 Transcript_37787/m.76871 type:complete len:394 (+) Transcript_37787:353-1534(+)
MGIRADGHLTLPIAAVTVLSYHAFHCTSCDVASSLFLAVVIYVASCVLIVVADSRFFRPFPANPTLTIGERSRAYGDGVQSSQWVTNFRTLGGLASTNVTSKDEGDPDKSKGSRRTRSSTIMPNAAYRCGAIKNAFSDESALLQFPPPKTIVDLRAISEARASPTIVPNTNCSSSSSSSNNNNSQKDDSAMRIVDLPAAALSLDDLKARKIASIEAITKLLIWQPSLLFGDVRPRLNEITVLCLERLILEPQFANQAVAKLLKLVSDPSNHPVVWHCSEGKDRTGAMSALFLLALGIPREVVIDDFVLSNKLLHKRAWTRYFQLRLVWLLTGRWISFVRYAIPVLEFMFVDGQSLQRCFAMIDATYGGFNEKYWKAQGLTLNDIQRLRDAVLM